MHIFYVLVLLSNLFFYNVSSVRMPLLDSLRAPLLIDIDVAPINHKLKEYIDKEIEKQVNDTCNRKIENVVTHRHTELRSKILDDISDANQKYESEFSSLARNLKLQFKQLVQNLKNENQVLKKQLETLNKEKSDELKDESDKHISGFESRFKQLEQNYKSGNQAFKTQMEKWYSDTIENLGIEMMKMNKTVLSSQKQVALTACISSYKTVSSGFIWKFDDIRSHMGINGLRAFKRTGKFTCDSEGLYLVSALIVSKTTNSEFYIYKNGSKIVRAFITDNSRDEWFSGTSVVAVQLSVHDKVWISAGPSMIVGVNHGSCVTIVKIK